MKIVAELISFLFNPILFLFIMPFMVVYRQTTDGLYATKWFLFTAIFTVLGILLFLIGRVRGTFSDFNLSKKKERRIVYTLAWFLSLSYLFIAILFKGIFFPLSIAAIGIVLGLLVFEVVTYKVKASIHVGAACAFVVSFGLLYGASIFFITVWTLPLVAWSRLYLKRHTLKEIVAGAFLGSAITLLTFYFGKQFIQ